MTAGPFTVVVCDLDGTLLDSDDALVAPFVALGVAAGDVTFGALPVDECARLGVDVRAYLDGYDTDRARPFPGVEQVVARLGRWVVCSNKDGRLGRAELCRLGWHPERAWFADDFNGPKRLQPLLDELAVAASDALSVGDTGHDRACAADAGVAFALAAWNPRARAEPGDLVLRRPADLLDLVA